MADETNREIEKESTYPEIRIPEFKSDIPEPLLKSSSDEAKYILDQLSVLSQYARWSAPVLVQINDQTRKTNGRLLRVEAWRTMLTSWWALVLILLTIAGAAAGIIQAIMAVRGGH